MCAVLACLFAPPGVVGQAGYSCDPHGKRSPARLCARIRGYACQDGAARGTWLRYVCRSSTRAGASREGRGGPGKCGIV